MSNVQRWLQATLVAANASISGPKLIVLLLVFVASCAIGTAISRSPVPIYDDVAEAISWGAHLEFGIYKHPPLFGWIAGLWFAVFPHNEP